MKTAEVGREGETFAVEAASSCFGGHCSYCSLSAAVRTKQVDYWNRWGSLDPSRMRSPLYSQFRPTKEFSFPKSGASL